MHTAGNISFPAIDEFCRLNDPFSFADKKGADK
jgi:hypothetical protein